MIRWMICALALILPAMAHADARLCEQAAAEAARRSGVPGDVMQALTLTETGRRQGGELRPWPWAINHAGEGHWFATQPEAMQYAQTALAQGMRNFDVGCFQLNHRWHGEHFSDLTAMFDPLTNALYAARFLREQYDRHGDWALAAGAYHSGTPEFADRYRQRFEALYAGNLPEPTLLAAAEPRVNHFPLLRGGAGMGGSLVPLGGATQRLIGN